jgi:lipoprotein-releasing system permease protein
LNNLSFYIAWRYLRASAAENKLLAFASLTAFVGVALGSMTLALAFAILEGFERELARGAANFSAHIEVRGFGGQALEREQFMLWLKNGAPNVRAAETYIEAEAIIRSKFAIEGVAVRGIQSGGAIGSLSSTVQRGAAVFSSPMAQEIIIGEKLAQKLGIDVGGKVVIYAVPFSSSRAPQSLADALSGATTTKPVIEQFTVAGVYRTQMSEYDDLRAYIPIARAQAAFAVPDGMTSGFAVWTHDLARAQETAAQIEKIFGYPFFPLTLYEQYDAMFAWIDLQKEPVPLILSLLSIVAAFNIVATLFMAVVQKMSSIGVLRALGMRRRQITNIFLLQGVALGASASLCGCALAFLLSLTQAHFQIIRLDGSVYFLSAVPVAILWQHYAIVFGASATMSALAAFIPARISGKIPVLKALRFQ